MGVIERLRSEDKDGAAAPQAKPGLFAALEVGTSKTVCFIVKSEATLSGSRLRVVGVGHQSSRGVRGGTIIDMDAAQQSIKTAVENAERMAGQAISEVTLVTAAGGLTSTRLGVEAPLSRREVSDRDLRHALREGLQTFAEPGRVMLHAIPLGWRVDNHRGVKDPRGMFGRELGVDLHIVTAAVEPLRNLTTCVERCRLSIAGIVATPYAAGLSALVEDEILLGAMVIDMGAATTSVGVFAEGSLIHVDGVPIGGAHVTSDIARGLSTPMSAAERIKVLYGSALDSPDDDQVMIETPPVAGEGDTMVQQPRALLNAVIRPRLEEVFELIRDRLDAAGVSRAAGRRLVLTGGAAQLPGAAELAGRVLAKQVRIGRPSGMTGLGDAVSGPAFSACAGVIVRRARGSAEAIGGPPRLNASGEQRRLRTAAGGDRGPKAILRWFAESF